MSELNIGIIGLGTVARVHARLLRQHIDGARISGAYSATAATTARFADDFSCTGFASAEDLVFSSTTSAVLVTSPEETHQQYVQMCLDAGKPVLCEKPLTPTAEGCLSLLETETGIGKRLVTVGFMRRYDAGYQRIQLALRQGGIGSPRVVHSIHRNPSPDTGYFWQRGITGVAIHDIDIISWLLDDKIDQIATISGGLGGESEVAPLLLSGRTTGGAVISIESFVNCGYGYDIGCDVAGTAGSISLAPSDEVTLRRDFHQMTTIPAGYAARFKPAFVRQLQAWCEAARSGTATGASLWDGLCAALVSDAAIRSKTSGALERVTYPAVPEIYRSSNENATLTAG